MAGIKETKDQLRNELKELHRKLSAMQSILVVDEATPSAWMEYAEIAHELAQKAGVLAHLVSIKEDEKEIPPTLVPELKTPAEIVPPLVPEIKMPENFVPPPKTEEKIIPPAPEVSKPEIVQSPPSQGGKTYPDLKSLIGFNEKIMFVRNLFNSSGTEYENALIALNACTSYREAEAVLQNLSSSRNWPRESEPVQIFYSLVKRRFA